MAKQHTPETWGRQGGLIGGPRRAAVLSPEKRAEIARKAARARWGKPRKDKAAIKRRLDARKRRKARRA